MARPKSDNIQINISIPSEWKKELENLAHIYSVEEGETITYLDLMRSGIRKNISQLPIGICLGVSVAGILSLFPIKKQAVTNRVFTTTLSVTALFRISKPKKVIHYCMVNNLFIFQTHLKRTCPQDHRCNISYITDNETFSI